MSSDRRKIRDNRNITGQSSIKIGKMENEPFGLAFEPYLLGYETAEISHIHTSPDSRDLGERIKNFLCDHKVKHQTGGKTLMAHNLIEIQE